MLKAVSLWNPWAILAALGLKKFETRGYKTSHRGEIAIHAAKACTVDALQRFAPEILKADPHILDDGVKGGQILCVVNLGIPIPTSRDLVLSLPLKEVSYGDFSQGRYAWPMSNLQRLKEPVPTRGRQYVWILPADVEAAVRKQLAEGPTAHAV